MFIIYDQLAINLKAITQTQNLSTSKRIVYNIHFTHPSQIIIIETPVDNPDHEILNVVKQIEDYIEKNLYKMSE